MKQLATQQRQAAPKQKKASGSQMKGPRQAHLTQLAADANARAQSASANRTGLPARLKSGIESLSGISMDAVRVHYNSAKPAQLNALAYAQGTDIHVAPGQERHVPHEAWHVVQQAQGRVRPTMMLKERVAVNDDNSLEHEADRMGARALSVGSTAQRILAASALEASSAPVQRTVEHANITTPASAALVNKFFSDYDAAVQRAYRFIVNVPSLHGAAALDGHTAGWVLSWNNYLGSLQTSTLAARFGYAIESLVCDANSPLAGPRSISGHNVAFQVPAGGTRPDLALLAANGSSIAWLDITASQSGGHIFLKDNWAAKVANFAETTYPSLDPATLSLMRQNKANQNVNITPELLERRKAAAAVEYAKNKAYWRGLGNAWFKGENVARIKNASGYSREHARLVDNVWQDVIRNEMIHKFGHDIDMKLVPSILAAMDVPRDTWSFGLGASESEKLGELWLLEHAPRPVARRGVSMSSFLIIAAIVVLFLGLGWTVVQSMKPSGNARR